MGLLDDAIREHLDLKRRRGADPAEIERAEREALGPVRRDSIATLASQPDAPDYPFAGSEPSEPNASSSSARPHRRRSLLRRSRYERDHGGPPHAGLSSADALPNEFALDPGVPEHLDPDVADLRVPERPDPNVADDLEARPERPAEALGARDEEHLDELAELSDLEPSVPPPVAAPAAGDETLSETVEYDVEGAFASQPDGEDVLEETPEFLQDTPDHDRLWFEQRPPRDFDFDG